MYTVKAEEHAPIKPSGFRWMPAALSSHDHAGLGCYVRHHRYKDEPIRVHHKETNRILITCPDRDLLVVRDQHHAFPYKPAEGVWDEFVNFSFFRPNAMTDNDLQFWMMNYTDYLGTDNAPNARNNRERLPHEGFIVADSGGFQLAQGRYEWLDPLEVVKWYNANVDLGMILDIPTLGVSNIDDLLTIAKAQKHNTAKMIAGKRDSLELINIFHGRSKDWISQFKKVVETPEIDRLALGGAYAGTLLDTMDSNFGIMYELRKEYKHFHVLGVWNLLQLIPFMRFASHGIVDLLTSDSSTALQNANAKRYAYQPAIDDTWRMRDLGLTGPCTQSNHHLTLPCHCSVCATLKYTDVLAILGGAALTHILSFHNVFQMNNYVKTMYPLVQKLSVKELTDLMMAQVGNRRGVHEAKWGIQLADAIADVGYDRARKKFSSYIPTGDVSYKTHTSLFDGDSDGDTGSNQVDDTGQEVTSEYAQRKVNMAIRYLKDDPIAAHGKKQEDSASKPKSTGPKSAGSSTRKMAVKQGG